MYILGVHDGHTATAALMKDGKILSVISEERLNRTKEWQGLPVRAIKKVLEINQATPQDIDLVVMCGKTQPTTYDNYLGNTFSTHMAGFNLFKKIMPHSLMKRNWWVDPVINISHALRNKNYIFSFFNSIGVDETKIIFADHHTCHAYSTFSNTWGKKDDMLILTLDGAGDGYCASVNKVENGKFITLDRTNIYNSLGLLYSRITQHLNMKPLSHEYKVMGLAAYSKEKDHTPVFKTLHEKFMRIDPGNPLRMENLSGAVNKEYLKEFDKHLKNTRFDLLAGGAQMLVEQLVHKWAKNAVRRTKMKDVFCSGGVFMNVKANMKLAYEDEIDKLFIFPSCGDESNAIGACNYGYKFLCNKFNEKFNPAKLKDIYFGPSFTEEDVLKALHTYKSQVNYEKIKDIDKFSAELLAEKKILARCSGKMEFGARALGNRSILAHPADRIAVREINEAIKQRDFWMPFAATILKEREKDYIVNPKNVPSPYMVLSFKTTEKAKDELINGMHQYDLTCRPQVLEKDYNEGYHKLIKSFEKKTGIGGVLNTSLNIHGDPVVCSPDEAIDTLLRSGLRHLILGDYYVTKRRK